MTKWIILLTSLIACASLALAVRTQLKTKRIFDSIEGMLRAAMRQEFLEKTYDETRLSKLETAFAHYLASSAISARAAAGERDQIKTLIADISHQTKTPLSNLLLYSELLQESDLTEDQKNNVDALHLQTEKLCFLIDSLVKLSRLENGILQMAPRTLSIAVLLQDICAQMLPKAAAKGLSLVCIPTDVYALFDCKWTTEALCNMVDNAIKYTGSGGITLSCIEYEMFARIDIADTGIGIREEDQPQIFGRFYRAGESREQEGVGIGLYLAREIVSAQNGYIRVTSVPGQGSVFSVFLPKEGS